MSIGVIIMVVDFSLFSFLSRCDFIHVVICSLLLKISALCAAGTHFVEIYVSEILFVHSLSRHTAPNPFDGTKNLFKNKY